MDYNFIMKTEIVVSSWVQIHNNQDDAEVYQENYLKINLIINELIENNQVDLFILTCINETIAKFKDYLEFDEETENPTVLFNDFIMDYIYTINSLNDKKELQRTKLIAMPVFGSFNEINHLIQTNDFKKLLTDCIYSDNSEIQPIGIASLNNAQKYLYYIQQNFNCLKTIDFAFRNKMDFNSIKDFLEDNLFLEKQNTKNQNYIVLIASHTNISNLKPKKLLNYDNMWYREIENIKKIHNLNVSAYLPETLKDAIATGMCNYALGAIKLQHSLGGFGDITKIDVIGNWESTDKSLNTQLVKICGYSNNQFAGEVDFNSYSMFLNFYKIAEKLEGLNINTLYYEEEEYLGIKNKFKKMIH